MKGKKNKLLAEHMRLQLKVLTLNDFVILASLVHHSQPQFLPEYIKDGDREIGNV